MAAQGTKVADVFIAIGGDLKGYTDSLRKAEQDAKSVGAQIRLALSGAGAIRPGIGGFITALKDGDSLSTALRANIRGIGADLGHVSFVALSNGLNALQGVGARVFRSLHGLASQVFKGFLLGTGIGAFLGLEQVIARLVHAIPDLIHKGKDYAEAVHSITLETGASVEAASKNLAIYKFLGGTQDQFSTQLVRLAARIKTNEGVLKSYGVATRDTNGNLLDSITLLNNLREVFSKLPDGPEKTAVAFKLFGQRGAQAFEPLIHFIGLTSEQFQKAGKDVTAQGLVLSEVSVRTADAVSRGWDRIQNAITGVAANLFTAIGPQIIAFLDSVAQTVTANAQRIVDALGSIANAALGLVEGLLGTSAPLDSFSTQFTRLDEGGANTSATLVTLQGNLDKLKAKLNPATEATKANNTAIDAGVKALDARSRAIDRQISALAHLGTVQDTVFRREIANLTRVYDAELALMDAEDQRIARQEQAAQSDRDAERAKRDLAAAQIDLANAQARYQRDMAEPDKDPVDQATKLKEGLIAIADASQKVRDAQQGIADVQQTIADNTRTNAEQDRRAQIASVESYVKSIEGIVTSSENHKAALITLKKREAVIADEIAAAKTKGNAQAVADLTVKLEAVKRGELAETAKITDDTKLAAFNKLKADIEKEKAALEAARTSASGASTAATKREIAAIEESIRQEKARITQEHVDAIERKRLHEINASDLISTYGKGGTANKAWDEWRTKGEEAAEAIKKAIGGLMDTLLGTEAGPGAGKLGPTRGRSGGLLGALSSIAGAFGTIASGVGDVLSGMAQFKPKDIGLGVAAMGVYFKIPQLIIAGLGLYGISLGIEAAVEAVGNIGKNPKAAADIAIGAGPPTTATPDTEHRLQAYRAQQQIDKLRTLDPTANYPDSAHTHLKETNAQALARLLAEQKADVYSHEGFQHGGYVQEPRGTPVPAIVHGGEYVLSNAMLDAIRNTDHGQRAEAGRPAVLPGVLSAVVRVLTSLPKGPDPTASPKPASGIGLALAAAGALLAPQPLKLPIILAGMSAHASSGVADLVRTVLGAYRGTGQPAAPGSIVPARTDAADRLSAITDRPTVKAYAEGGPVPGPRNAPFPAIVHGGEYVVTVPKVDLADRLLGALSRFSAPHFVPASIEGGPFVIENHTHVHIPWDNATIDFVSRALAYRRRS